MKIFLAVVAFLILGAVNAEAQYGGSCAHAGCAAVDVVHYGVSSSAEAHCELLECFFMPNPPTVTASSWVIAGGWGCNNLTFVASIEESWSNGYVTSWITVAPLGYPYFSLASFGIAKDWSNNEVARSEWVASGWESCLSGGVS